MASSKATSWRAGERRAPRRASVQHFAFGGEILVRANHSASAPLPAAKRAASLSTAPAAAEAVAFCTTTKLSSTASKPRMTFSLGHREFEENFPRHPFEPRPAARRACETASLDLRLDRLRNREIAQEHGGSLVIGAVEPCRSRPAPFASRGLFGVAAPVPITRDVVQRLRDKRLRPNELCGSSGRAAEPHRSSL